METPLTEKERMTRYLENWKVVSAEIEREKAEKLLMLTEEQAAAQFNEMYCDPSLVWTPEERRISSGLVEQQRLFMNAQRHAPGLHRCT